MAHASNNLNALRQKALVYYKANGIPKKVEEVLNSMFHDNPPDPYGYLVNFFSEFAEPSKLSKISASMVYDGQGLPAIEINVFCTVCNKDKFISSSVIANRDIKLWLEEREKACTEMKASVLSGIDFINSVLSEKLKGMDPFNQIHIDQLLVSFIEEKKQMEEKEREKNLPDDSTLSLNTTPAIVPQPPKNKRKASRSSAKVIKSGNVTATVPDKPLELFTLGSEAVVAISQAVCRSAAISHNHRIYQHVASIAQNSKSVNRFRLPLPMITIIQGGKSIAGKQNFIKEFMVVPGVTVPLEKAIQHIADISSHVSKVLISKFGVTVKYVNENGALCPPLDQPHQGLDLIVEAIHALGLIVNKDMHLAVNIAANEIFDHDKGKYEIIDSTWKSPEEMLVNISDLLSKYPSIVAIIDPLRGEPFENFSEDSEAWTKLCEKVSKSVYIVGDNFYSRPGLLSKEPIPSAAFTSGISMNFERLNTVSDVISCAKTFQALKNEIIISANEVETTDTFIVDFSVGIQARFLKIGGMRTGERACKINRLLQIYNELEHTEVVVEQELEIESTSIAEEVEEEVIVNKPSNAGEEEEVKSPDVKEELEIKDEPVELEDDGKMHLKLHEPFIFPQINCPLQHSDAATEVEDSVELKNEQKTD